MKISSICRHRIVTVDRESTAAAAAALMREHHVGALIVTASDGEGERVVGVVTDRDLVLELLALGLDGKAVRVGTLASHPLATVAEDDDLSAAVLAMRDAAVRRLLVVDGERRLSGIVSFDDLLVAQAADMAGFAAVVRSGIERESAQVSTAPASPATAPRVPAMGTAGWGQVLA